MEEVQKIMSNFLLAFQVSLGLWQFLKLTSLGGLVQGVMGWLLSLLPFPCLSPAYALLHRYQGRVFKRVSCAVLTKVPALHEELTVLSSFPSGEDIINLSYLGENRLERKDGNKLFINGKMSYYITHAIWQNLVSMTNAFFLELVCLEGYKQFWELVAAGGVMTLSEALDCILLENHTFMASDNDWLLPVNLSLSEEKVLKLLNLVGLFLQTKKVFWLIPASLSVASAMLEFNTTLRAWLYRNINRVFCSSMHLICDKLSYSKRRQVYSLGKWVENLKPCNDIELRVVRGDVCAFIGGLAKAPMEDASLVPWLHVEEAATRKTFHCDPIIIMCFFREETILTYCTVAVYYPNSEVANVVVDCSNREEFRKMCTFVDCVARYGSGSLKSYDGNNKVEVRGWKESVTAHLRTQITECNRGLL